jgi:acyl dehydratase
MREINGIEELKGLEGEELGSTDWHEVTQEDVNAFADATGDHQWIHVDPERAKDTPFGGTIAHGYYTLSLSPRMMDEIATFKGIQFALNYGLGKVRFPAPLPVGSRFRATARVTDITEVAGGIQVTTQMTYEREGGDKPVCVADTIARFYG